MTREEKTHDTAIEFAISELASESSFARVDARDHLVSMKEKAVPYLTDALKSKNQWVRWEAAKALSKISDPAASQALIDALEDKMFDVRWIAAEGIIAIGRKALIPLLSALTKSSDSLWLREGAHHVIHDLMREDLKAVFGPVLDAIEKPQGKLAVPLAAEKALDELKKILKH
jgi:HEAT repeat protein